MSKEEFITALSNEGFNADFANGGVPTVFVESAFDIKPAHTAIKKLIKTNGYNESYGISMAPARPKAPTVISA